MEKKTINNLNNKKFYIARDKRYNELYLYLGKPFRSGDMFVLDDHSFIMVHENYFNSFGLNPKDFEHLKFEDEPVEVFIQL